MVKLNISLKIILLFFIQFSFSQQELHKGFEYLDEFIPNIVYDLRYGSEDNFTGKVVRGYEKVRPISTTKMANALKGLNLFIILIFLIAAVNFLTEITSNLATTAMLLPVLASIAVLLEVHPFIIMTGSTVAASCAFMLPAATPPNAVVFGSGYLRIPDMVKAGILMNLFSIIFLALMVFYILPILWGIDPGNFKSLNL